MPSYVVSSDPAVFTYVVNGEALTRASVARQPATVFFAAAPVATYGPTIGGAVAGSFPGLGGALVGDFGIGGEVGGSFPALAGTLTAQPAPIVATQYPGTVGDHPTMTAPSDSGNRVEHGTRLLVVNDSGSSVVLTIATPLTVEGLALGDGAVTIPSGSWPTNARFVDVPYGLYAQPGDGLCHLSWSALAGVSFAVLGRHSV